MKMLVLLSLFTSAMALSCSNSDNALRCVDPNGDDSGANWRLTAACMKRVGFEDTCWCYGRAEDYASPSDDKVQAFKDCCGGYNWDVCP